MSFKRFRWSGRNRHEDRTQAAEHLASALRQRTADFPGVRHVVIGHSHGGNIAVAAIGRFPELQQKIHAVVCLSTPFFLPTRRQLRGLKLALETAGPLARFLVGFLILAYVTVAVAMLLILPIDAAAKLFAVGPSKASEVAVIPALLIAAAAGILATKSFSRWVRKHVIDRYHRVTSNSDARIRELEVELCLNAPIATPIYAVVAWGDEARLGIAASSALGAVPGNLLRIAGGILSFGFVAVFLFGWFVNPLMLTFKPELEAASSSFAGHAIYWLVIGACACLPLALVVPASIGVLQGVSQGFGLDDVFVMQARTAWQPPTTPPAECRSLGILALLRRRGLKALWRHSVIAGDAVAIQEVADWLSSITSSNAGPDSNGSVARAPTSMR